MNDYKFLEIFNDLLKDNDLNRKKFSAECNIPYTTVVGWTTLGRLPDYTSLIKIADYFDCSLDYLTGRHQKYEVSDETSATAERNRKLLSAFNALDDDGKELVYKLAKKLAKS